MSIDPQIDSLARAIEELGTRPLVVVTGAGISHASGIATFRGSEPDAVWNVSDVEIATAAFLDADPVGQWQWYLSRFAALDSAQPNAGHLALSELEGWCSDRTQFTLVTQNIDTLHEEAGSRQLIKVHGTADRLRCTRPNCPNGAPRGSIDRSTVDLRPFEAQPSDETLPKCPLCGSYLRAHVLFFDEYYTDHVDYRIEDVQHAALSAGIILFVGTSFSVGVTELFLRQGETDRVPMYSIDPTKIAPPSTALQTIEMNAEVALPQLLERLRKNPKGQRNQTTSSRTPTTHATRQIPFQPDEVLAQRYRIKRYIAQGAVGVVFEAEDLELGGLVAIKVLRAEYADSSAAMIRFLREVQLARRVTHPNVCRIFDLGKHPLPDGRQTVFLSMELLRGETLGDWIAAHAPAPLEAVLPIVRQLVDALDTAHEAGVIHRDFKPSNVVIENADADSIRAVVTDFGLSRSLEELDGDDYHRLTKTGHLVGTPAYVAPEQLQGNTPTNATDIYALGLVIYEMVTAHLPFTGDNPLAMAFKRLRDLPIQPERFRPDLDPIWSRAVQRCLEIDPTRRYGSGRELLQELEPRPDRRPRKRSRTLLALLAVAAVVTAFAVYNQILKRPPVEQQNAPTVDSASLTASPQQPARHTTVVLPFEDRSGAQSDSWLRNGFSEMLRTELAAGGLFLSMPGEDVRRIVKDLGVESVDRLDEQTRTRIARLTRAPILITGTFEESGPSQAARSQTGPTQIATPLPAGALQPSDTAASTPRANLRIDFRAHDIVSGRVESDVVEGNLTDPAGLAAEMAIKLRQLFAAGTLSAEERERLRAAQPRGESARLYNLGLEQLQSFDASSARLTLEDAVAADPDYPLAHSALSDALSRLGYDELAATSAKRAFELSNGLPREQQFVIEARYRSSRREHERLEEIYRTLHNYYPDNPDYAVQMVEAQQLRGLSQQALDTIESLRPTIDDPRLLILEARSARQVSELERAATIARRADQRAADLGARSLRAEALLERGFTSQLLGNIDLSRTQFEESLAIASQLENRSAVAAAQAALASSLDYTGAFSRGQQAYELPLATYREIGDASGMIFIYSKMAHNAMRRRAFEEASSWIDQGERLADDVGDPYRRNDLRSLRGSLLWEQQNLAASERILRRALEEEKRLGRLLPLGSVSNNLANTLYDRGKFDEAIDAYQQALVIQRRAGFRLGEADVLNNLGTALWLSANLPAAQDRLEAALKIYEEIDSAQGKTIVLFNLAELSYDRGLIDLATERLESLLELLKVTNAAAEVPSTEITLARVELAANRLDDAHRRAAAATRALSDAGDPAQVWAYAVLAQTLLALDRPQEALAALEKAGDLPSQTFELDLEQAISVRIVYQRTAARLYSPQEAAEALRRIIDQARQLDFPRQEFQAMIALGEVEYLAGRPGDAEQLLRRVMTGAQAVGLGLYVRQAEQHLNFRTTAINETTETE